MRTIPSDYQSIIETGKFSTKYKVEIYHNSAWVDITTLENIKWVNDITIRADIDDPVMSADISIITGSKYLSINPFNQDSAIYDKYGEVLRLYKRIRILVKLVYNFEPQDWINIFEGYIDKIEVSNEGINISCRDLGGRLQDTWIEEERVYGSDSGSPVYTEMQKILNDNATNIGYSITLRNLMTSDIWYVKKWKQERVSVLEALQSLAEQIGWVVRYLWSPSDNEWRLTFYSPDRTKTTPDFMFTNPMINEMNSLEIDIAGIRNVVQVVYYPSGSKKPSTVVVSDQASIQKYGRRFMEIAEDKKSLINTQAEAERLANACLSDLKEPKAVVQAQICVFPFVELGDLYYFPPTQYNSTALSLAVVNFEHRISEEESYTTLSLKGTPSSAYYNWHTISAITGLPTKFEAQPSIKSILTAGNGVKLYLGIEPPISDLPDFDHFEIHAWKLSNFTPNDSTLIGISHSLETDIVTLPDFDTIDGGAPNRTAKSGTQAYFKVIAVDKYGNTSTPSEELAYATSSSLKNAYSITVTTPDSNNNYNVTVDISNLALSNPPIVISTPMDIRTYNSSYTSSQRLVNYVSNITASSFSLYGALELVGGTTTFTPNQTIYWNGTYTSSTFTLPRSIIIEFDGNIALRCIGFPGSYLSYSRIYLQMKLQGYSGTQWIDLVNDQTFIFWFPNMWVWYDAVVSYYQNPNTSYIFWNNPNQYSSYRLVFNFNQRNNYTEQFTYTSSTWFRIRSITVEQGGIINGGTFKCIIIPQD